MNSMVFHLPSYLEICENIEKDLYMARRYHLVESFENYFDFDQKKPIVG